jgi:hypothetical protein
VRFIRGTGILAGESSCGAGPSFSVDHLGANRVKGATLVSLETGRCTAGTLGAAAASWVRSLLLLTSARGLRPAPPGVGGGWLSESGSIEIDSSVGTGDELLVLVYFPGKFRSAIEGDVALLLPGCC